MASELPPLGFQKRAEQNDVFNIATLVDVGTGRMLLPNTFRTCDMKIGEAMMYASCWWQQTARHAMPDKQKSDDYINTFGVASGVLLGLDWDKLTKDEQLKVLKAWWFNIGVKKFVHGLGTSRDDRGD